jgi:ethanolamine ammonia-lyase large subunit
MMVGAKCQVVVRANSTLGLPGRLSSRCQPNHPTDDVEGILASAREGLAYGCGDAVIGINPATDTARSTAEILRAVDDLLRCNAVPTQHCVLSHVTVQMKTLEFGCPMDLMFQSVAGTQAANAAFGIWRGEGPGPRFVRISDAGCRPSRWRPCARSATRASTSS